VFVDRRGALVAASATGSCRQRRPRRERRRQIYYRADVPSRRGQIYDRSGTIVLAASVMRDRLIVAADKLTRATARDDRAS
jgi:hypothetical protein